MRFFYLHLTILLLCTLTLTARRSRAQLSDLQVADFRVEGYLPDYRFYIDVGRASSHLTDLILFSAKPTASGMLVNFVKPDQIELAMANKAANPNLRVLMSIGGGGRSENFLAVASDTGKRLKFVQAVHKMLDKYSLDGVDLDWESPRTEIEYSSYVRLLNEIHVSFAGTTHTLTVALHPGQTLGEHGYHAVDRVHFMSYDMPSTNGNHADFASVRQAVDRIIASGCPKDKLVLGLPLYARNKESPGDVKSYAELMDSMVAIQLEAEDDAEDNVETAEVGAKDNAKETAIMPFVERLAPSFATASAHGSYPYDSMYMAQRKTQWAKNSGLRGVFFWEIGQDKLEPRVSVLEAVMAVGNGTVKIPHPGADLNSPDGASSQIPTTSARERRKDKRAQYQQPVLPEEPRKKKKRRSKNRDEL